MQAIQTKYLSATNTKGSRIKAWCDAGSVTIGYSHEYHKQEAHQAAAHALVVKLGWLPPHSGELVGGALPGQNGYCFVMVRAVNALGNLIQWAAGNRGDKHGNPYCVPEVKAALKELQAVNGCAEWLDAADGYTSKD